MLTKHYYVLGIVLWTIVQMSISQVSCAKGITNFVGEIRNTKYQNSPNEKCAFYEGIEGTICYRSLTEEFQVVKPRRRRHLS